MTPSTGRWTILLCLGIRCVVRTRSRGGSGGRFALCPLPPSPLRILPIPALTKHPPLCLPPFLLLQSYLHGLFVGSFDPAAVALHTSRGYETYFSKQLMRWTVLLSDILSKHPIILKPS